MQESFLVRLPYGKDLLEAIGTAFDDRSVKKASFTLIGALTKAVLAFYDPDAREYRNKEFSGLLEIAGCTGNVSEKDGELFVHAHAILAGHDFGCVGGHLMPGAVIFAAELHATPVPGETPVRVFDEQTGLYLWSNA